MRKFFAILIFVGLASAVQAQVNLRAIWDYHDLDTPNITRFEVKIDSGSWQDIGIPAPQVFPETLPGHHSFVFQLLNVSNGPHTFFVRACDPTDCSFEVSKPYKLIGPAKNPRIER